jgi:hypothetical protein
MKTKITLLCPLVVGFLLAQAPLQAIPITGSPVGLASPGTTITFSEVVLASGTPIANQYSAFGVTFSNVTYNPQPGTTGPNVNDPNAGNFILANPALNPFSIMFNQAQTAADFALVTNPGSTTLFQSFLGGNPVESFSVPTDFTSPNNFFGFTNSLFNEIRVTISNENPSGLFDNLQFTSAGNNVPDSASTIILLSIGAGALAFVRRFASI